MAGMFSSEFLSFRDILVLDNNSNSSEEPLINGMSNSVNNINNNLNNELNDNIDEENISDEDCCVIL